MQVTEKSIDNSVVIRLMKKKSCRDPGSNQGPLDLQSNALPTELSRLHTFQLVQYKITYRELNSPVSIESSCVESRWVGWLSLTLDSTGVARHCAVGLKLFGTIKAGHRFHDDKVDCWVSRSPNLQLEINHSGSWYTYVHSNDVEKKCLKCDLWGEKLSWPIAWSLPIKTGVVISVGWPYLRVCCGHIWSHLTTFDVSTYHTLLLCIIYIYIHIHNNYDYVWSIMRVIPMGDRMNHPLGHTRSTMLKYPAIASIGLR